MRACSHLILVAALIGCGGIEVEPWDDSSPEQPDDPGKTDNIYPSGTYTREAAGAGELALLTLNPDKTFRRELVTPCSGSPCSPQVETGRYAFTRSGSYRYLGFKEDDGTLIDRYAYALDPAGLSLRKVYTSIWFSMTSKPATPPPPPVGGETLLPTEACSNLSTNPPASGWNGTHHLLVWDGNLDGILGARLAPSGKTLDATPIVIHADTYSWRKHYAVASDGKDFVVSWASPEGILARKISAQGTPGKTVTWTSSKNWTPGSAATRSSSRTWTPAMCLPTRSTRTSGTR